MARPDRENEPLEHKEGGENDDVGVGGAARLPAVVTAPYAASPGEPHLDPLAQRMAAG